VESSVKLLVARRDVTITGERKGPGASASKVARIIATGGRAGTFSFLVKVVSN
jgi:hypothetical protein